MATFRNGVGQAAARQYLTYLSNLLKNWASIRSRRPVSELGQFLPATVGWRHSARGLVVGVIFGIVSAVWRNRPIDFICASSRSWRQRMIFWLALIGLIVLYLRWGVVPGPGAWTPGSDHPPVSLNYTPLTACWQETNTFRSTGTPHPAVPGAGAYSAG